jgi:RecA-family ATPase
MIGNVRPSLVVIDTQRALFDLDEKEATQVGPAFTWLGEISTAYRCCIVVLHHLRKMGAMNNGERERVSGSRALITGVDVHLQAKASGGQPMRALYVAQ